MVSYLYGNKIPVRTLEGLSDKLKRGFSPLIAIVGTETGIGKSMLGGTISEKVYYRAFGGEWKPKGNLFFKMSEFKDELFNSNKRIFIIEEAEIELGSDEWYSIQNKFFSRMKSTQRIKNNLYIVILPMISLLAPKHRRALDWIFNVRQRGLVDTYKVLKRASRVSGEDLSTIWVGRFKYPLPYCKKEYDRLDIENKRRIEIEEGQILEEKQRLKNLKKDRNLNKIKYKCPYCGYEGLCSKYIGLSNMPRQKVRCGNMGCGKFVTIKIDDDLNVNKLGNKTPFTNI